jgi:hypothetical protein
VASTASETAQSSDGYVWVGRVTTASSTSGETGGAGGGGCIAFSSWIMDDVYADDLVKGSRLIVWDTGKEPWLGEVKNDPVIKIRPCVRLETESGIQLECSVDTPITQPDGRSVHAAHIHGGMLLAEQGDGSWQWERVKNPVLLPDGPVVYLSVGGISLAAASKPGLRVMTHNIQKF